MEDILAKCYDKIIELTPLIIKAIQDNDLSLYHKMNGEREAYEEIKKAINKKMGVK
jgi:hypothetical protein